MNGKNILATVATILLAFAVQNANAEYDVATYCQLVPSGTRMPSFASCQNYYICNAVGTDPTEASCLATQTFDVDTQTCRTSSLVTCYYGDENPCANKVNGFVPAVNNCGGWISCANGVENARGNCPSNQIFDSATSSCVWGSCSNDDDTEDFDSVANVCEIMQVNTFFGSFDDCTAWNRCNALNVAQVGSCGAGLVYNTQRRMCLTNDGTMCDRTNGDTPLTPQEPCDATNKDALMGDSNICSIYYKCNGATWLRQTCTTGNFFSVPAQKCLDRQTATPVAGCNRCQFSTATWVNAVDETCQDYLTCNDGAFVGQGTCPTDQFFNEQRQGCMAADLGLDAYVSVPNGACAPKGDETPVATTEDPNEATTVDEGETTVDDGKTTEDADGATTEDAGDATTVDTGDDTTVEPTTEETTVEPTTEETTTVDPEDGGE